MRRRSVDSMDRAAGSQGPRAQHLEGCSGEGGHHLESHGEELSQGWNVTRPTFLRDVRCLAGGAKGSQ